MKANILRSSDPFSPNNASAIRIEKVDNNLNTSANNKTSIKLELIPVVPTQ